MLLPSALSCDSSHRNAPPTRFQSAAALFSSPPTSPAPNAQSTLFATCRALQSMLSSPNQLPTPPMTHAPAPSPSKLRLRSRKPADGDEDVTAPRIARRKIAKRNNGAPRGINKRRRPIDDDAARNITPESGDNDENLEPPDETMMAPSTPKRMRLGPEVLPRGLERSDFHALQNLFTAPPASAATERQLFPPPHNEESSKRETPAAEDETRHGNESRNQNDKAAAAAEQEQEQEQQQQQQQQQQQEQEEVDQWSSAEDRLLVELVLEKLKLSKSDWQDCARSLGKDRGSVGRRWKSLMGGGEVGLKCRPGGVLGLGPKARSRGRICATWRG